MREEVLLIGDPDALVGIVTIPDEAERGDQLPALLLLNSGMLHRVGPNRLYVKMARALASEGFLVLRFDLSGIGDSDQRDDSRSMHTRWTAEVREAMGSLEETYGAKRFGLMGICLGATLSFKAACEDSRVLGAALINPQDHLHDGANELLHSEIWDSASARHNWRIAFSSSMSSQKWWKALRGEVDFRSVARLLRVQAKGLFQRSGGASSELAQIESSFVTLRARGAKILHIYSEGDVGLDYLRLMLGRRFERYRTSGDLEIEIVSGSNHTFTLLDNQEDLMASVGRWAHALPRS
jgi:pimeloyl-ACP methyl ester carboxylesterase